jgi:hypothetical protein
MPKNIVRRQIDGWQYIDITVHHNQKVVKIIKRHQKGMMFDLASNKAAIKNLTPSAFMLYSHFIQNIPDFIEVLSRKTLLSTTALSERTYDSAVKELITKGYLVKTDHPDYSDYYLFYEAPLIDASL